MLGGAPTLWQRPVFIYVTKFQKIGARTILGGGTRRGTQNQEVSTIFCSKNRCMSVVVVLFFFPPVAPKGPVVLRIQNELSNSLVSNTKDLDKVLLLIQNAWPKVLLRIQNVWTKILLQQQNVWKKSCFESKLVNLFQCKFLEQKSCFESKMFEQKSCFDTKMLEQTS